MKDKDARRDIKYLEQRCDSLRNDYYKLQEKYWDVLSRFALLEKHLGIEHQPVSKEHPKYVKVEPK